MTTDEFIPQLPSEMAPVERHRINRRLALALSVGLAISIAIACQILGMMTAPTELVPADIMSFALAFAGGGLSPLLPLLHLSRPPR